MVDRMDQFPVMGDKDQSPASFTTCAREKHGDFTCVLIVEVADRFVGEDERGIVDESPGNRDALLLNSEGRCRARSPRPTASRSFRPCPGSDRRIGSIGTRMFSSAVSCGSRL